MLAELDDRSMSAIAIERARAQGGLALELEDPDVTKELMMLIRTVALKEVRSLGANAIDDEDQAYVNALQDLLLIVDNVEDEL
jgi:hypothetical protein